MDADELLARQLQAEEDRAAAQSQPRAEQAGMAERGFQARLVSGVQTAMQYEDEMLQALALSVIPQDQLRERARAAAEQTQGAVQAEEDAFAWQLLSWFKRDFFTWVNNPACAECGCKDTAAVGMGQPTPDEASGAAGRVELYRCPACASITRFPRLNDPGRLLHTRTGRCGEWANAFCLCARACGLDTRYVLDLTDHVWAEYYSAAMQRWVHMDPCEDAYDQPLLYEAGWGKKLTYVLAFSKDGVCDVTRRYTKGLADLLPRRSDVSEQWLAGTCGALTQRMRAQIGPSERRRLEGRDAAEERELSGQQHAPLSAAEAPLPGRQTGTVEWRAVRGELGNRAAPAATVLARDPKAAVATNGTDTMPALPAAGLPPSSEPAAPASSQPLPASGATPMQPAAGGASQAPDAPRKAAAQAGVGVKDLGRRFKERLVLPAGQGDAAVSSGRAGAASTADAKALLGQRVKEKFGSLMAAGGITPNEAAAMALKWATSQP